MYLRISSAALALGLLAGCGDASPAPEGEKIECAIGLGAAFDKVCTLERVAGRNEIVLHHPDGGFRRLTTDPASGAPVPVDGAEPAVIEEAEGAFQIAVGPDRYRITREPPATPAP